MSDGGKRARLPCPAWEAMRGHRGMVRGVQWEAMGGARVQSGTSHCRRVAASSTNEFGCEAMLVGRVMFCADSCSGVTALCKANELSFHLLGQC